MEKLRKHIEEIITVTDEEFESTKPFFTVRKVLKNKVKISNDDQNRS